MAFNPNQPYQGQQLPNPQGMQPNMAPQGYGQNQPYQDRPQMANPTPGAPRGGSAIGRNPAGGPVNHFPTGYTPIPAVKRPFKGFFNPFANPLNAGGGIDNALARQTDLGFNGQGDISQLILQALAGGM